MTNSNVNKDAEYNTDEFTDVEVFNRLTNRVCENCNLYMYGFDAKGRLFVDMKGGKKNELQRLQSLIGEEKLHAIYERVSNDEMENQTLEDTSCANIKVGAVTVYSCAKPAMTWMVIGVLSDEKYKNYATYVPCEQFSFSLPEVLFTSMLDIIRDYTALYVNSKMKLENAEAEQLRSSFSEAEALESLRRMESISNMLNLLESNESIELIMNTDLAYISKYLGISHAYIVKYCSDPKKMNVIAEWIRPGVPSFFEGTLSQDRISFIGNNKPVVVSWNTLISVKERESLNQKGISALIAIRVCDDMYMLLLDNKIEKQWKVDEIQFVYDSNRILTSILTKRIQKNSLISSYACLEDILNNVGCAIYVKDSLTGEMLFANQILRNVFKQELETGHLDELFDTGIPVNRSAGIFEVNHSDKNKWYDLRLAKMKWINGQQATLYAAYDVTDKKNYQYRIEQQAYTDFLTGLYNRLCCERDIASYVDMTTRDNSKGAILYLDLDDFKHINDGLGHKYGDILLKSISHSLRKITAIQNTCYRMGGDEFVIIVPPESYEHFDKIIEEIKNVFSKPWFLKESDYYCTMSMGIVEFPKCGDNVQDLIKKADIAMYEAKKSGKNRVARFSSKIESSSNKRLDMEKNMRDAMISDCSEFEVFYQPIIDAMAPGTPCVGAEALIRWNSNELGFVAPCDFIPLAEYLGLINPIGNYVLRTACKTLKYWNENGHPNYHINVNLSVVQLLQTDIVDIVKKTIEEVGINPENLTLEVTESLAINDMERMKKILNSIKTLGVKIALDDFGTGYSSLNHIREIPFDVIKVDQSFVKELAEDAYSQAFVKMVAELAETIGVSVCVEGIETEGQFKVLENMKVKMIQGYYFDRPLRRSVFEEKYI